MIPEVVPLVQPGTNGKNGHQPLAEGGSETKNGQLAGPHLDPVDLPKIEAAVREILVAIGEDPDREGLLETPNRVARAYQELCSGMREDAGVHLARQFEHEATGDDAVILRGVRFTSMCEHHLLPFVGSAAVAYLPAKDRVAGLSKIARTVDVFASRPQLQERLTAQIADALVEHLSPRGVAVVVEAEHSCLTLRGASKPEATMATSAFRGAYADDRALRTEVLSLMRSGQVG